MSIRRAGILYEFNGMGDGERMGNVEINRHPNPMENSNDKTQQIEGGVTNVIDKCVCVCVWSK